VPSIFPAETGRTEVDREVIARTLIGLMNNANVGGIVLLAVKSGAVRFQQESQNDECFGSCVQHWKL